MRSYSFLLIFSCLALSGCTTTKPLENQTPAVQIKHYNANCAHSTASTNRNPNEPFAHMIQTDPLCENH